MSYKNEEKRVNITRQVERMPVAQLKPHAAYERLLGQPSDRVVRPLFDSLLYNAALEAPVEVLPDGTVLRGYEYVVAADEAGRKELEVVKLDGLQNASEAMIESHVIEAAIHGDHAGRMAKLRCLERAIEISQDLPLGQRPFYSRRDLAASAAEILGKKRRSVQHFIQALNTPRQVQDALDAGELNVHEAKAVAGLSQAVKDEIALALKAGGVPREVVKGYTCGQSKRHKDVVKARDAFMKYLEKGLTDLEDRVDKVGWLTPAQKETLVRTKEMLQVLENCPVISQAQQDRNLEALFGRGIKEEKSAGTRTVS